MRKFILLAFISFLVISCSEQHKAEKAVSDFILKFATFPDSYEPIDFYEIEYCKNDYGIKSHKIKHAYRIKDKSGKLIVTAHEFKLSENFIVYVDFMEEFE